MPLNVLWYNYGIASTVIATILVLYPSYLILAKLYRGLVAWQPAVAAWRWPIGTAVRLPRVAEPVAQPEFGCVYHEKP